MTQPSDLRRPTRFRLPAAAVLAIFLVFLISVLGGVPTARANSTLIQQSNSGCTTVYCSPSPISFPSSVTAGDVIVVMIAVVGSGLVTSVSDTLGSAFTIVAEGTVAPMNLYIYDATLSSSGSDSIFVSFAAATQGGVYVYEVSGVTTVGAVYTAGTDTCYPPPCSISTSTDSASFQSGAFLVSMVGYPQTPWFMRLRVPALPCLPGQAVVGRR